MQTALFPYASLPQCSRFSPDREGEISRVAFARSGQKASIHATRQEKVLSLHTSDVGVKPPVNTITLTSTGIQLNITIMPSDHEIRPWMWCEHWCLWVQQISASCVISVTYSKQSTPESADCLPPRALTKQNKTRSQLYKNGLKQGRRFSWFGFALVTKARQDLCL